MRMGLPFHHHNVHALRDNHFILAYFLSSTFYDPDPDRDPDRDPDHDPDRDHDRDHDPDPDRDPDRDPSPDHDQSKPERIIAAFIFVTVER